VLAVAALLMVVAQGRASRPGSATAGVEHPGVGGPASRRGQPLARTPRERRQASLRARATERAARLIPKPPWAVVPSTVRVLELTVGRPAEPPRLARTFTEAAKVRAIAAAINRMRRSQARSCGLMGPNEYAPEASFTFRATIDGAVLARANAPAWTRTESGACDDSLSLAVPGRGAVALGHGRVVEQAEAALGVQIYTYRYRL
jgi:hypothetical protein